MKKKKQKGKKKFKLWTVALPVLVLIGVFFYVNPDWWYLLTSGYDRETVSLRSSVIPLTELSLEEMTEKEEFCIDQSLLLINTDYMLDEKFAPETGEYKTSGVQMNTCILQAFAELSAAVKEKCNDRLYVSSGIRDREKQAQLYAEDPDTATVPGASEHETGLCMDVYVANFAGDGFLKSKAGRFVNSHCHDYGFIIRYPYYGEESTGIRFEPWHIRYVGQPHADIIYNNKLTLEEYILGLEEGICYEAGRYYIIRQKPVAGKLLVPENCERYVVSYDNTGCYIVTGEKKVSQIRDFEELKIDELLNLAAEQ